MIYQLLSALVEAGSLFELKPTVIDDIKRKVAYSIVRGCHAERPRHPYQRK
ncbi:MAG TPA: hypothetical protein VM899_04685 [Rubellimicrobium sp.]|nr:hypothetical protein [Rubellimicrobium sp.]